MVGFSLSIMPISVSSDQHLVSILKTRKTNFLPTSQLRKNPSYCACSLIIAILMFSVFYLNNYIKMLGWILITLATIAILVSCCLARCCSPLTSLQHCYWTNHLHNERELFEQAAEQHSRLIIMQRIKKLFGFIPGKEDVKHIRIPSCQDWRDISAPSLFCMGEDLQGRYSFLGDRVDEDNEESKPEGIELKP